MALVSGTAQSHLLAMAQRVTKSKDAVLFRSGEPAFGVFLVRKGSVGLRLEARRGTHCGIVPLPETPSSVYQAP